MNKIKIIIILAALIFVLSINMAQAADSSKGAENLSWIQQILSQYNGQNNNLIPDECRVGIQGRGTTECGIYSMIQLMINVIRVMLGIIGSLALLMFVWGGFQFIFAGLLGDGQSERINKAKTTLTNAVIGLVVILSAWVIINFVIIALTAGGGGLKDIGTIFGKPWETNPNIE